MKKIILCLCLMALVAGCSSDDDKIDDAIVIQSSELISINATSGKTWGYTKNNENINLFYFYENPIFAFQGKCPVDHENPKLKRSIVFWSDNHLTSNWSNPYLYCEGCKARFDVYTGAAKNAQAEGYKLSIYKVKATKDFKTFYVWK